VLSKSRRNSIVQAWSIIEFKLSKKHLGFFLYDRFEPKGSGFDHLLLTDHNFLVNNKNHVSSSCMVSISILKLVVGRPVFRVAV